MAYWERWEEGILESLLARPQALLLALLEAFGQEPGAQSIVPQEQPATIFLLLAAA